MLFDIRPSSSNNIFRKRRVKRLNTLIDHYVKLNGVCTIIDIGGTASFWHTWKDHFDFEKIDVLCVNLDPVHGGRVEFSNVKVQYGDATNLSEFADRSFDVAFSNSVIEHVGMWRQQEKFATEMKRVAESYFVQTPYFFFPIEPHSRTPFLHWLPDALAYRIIMMKRCGFWPRAKDVSAAMNQIQSARMIGATQFSYLFDDAVVERERFLGWTKSLIAIRNPAIQG
jgi:ubiquinone/menaquinone biosynthesis C-methylase UbiE